MSSVHVALYHVEVTILISVQQASLRSSVIKLPRITPFG